MSKINPQHFARCLDEAKTYLRFLESIGCGGIGAGEKAKKIAEEWQISAKPGADLEGLLQDIRHCRRCRLADERGAAVFGAGDPNARVMFVGGFPEAADEAAGVPYSGDAGQLLTKIIEAMELSRESVYICHAVKCRPATDRLPDRFEARACSTYLEKQIAAVKPDIICALGGFAAQTLLRVDEPLSRIRGRFHDYSGISVMPTHDPAYLLLHPAAKRAVWEDLKRVMAAYKSLNIH